MATKRKQARKPTKTKRKNTIYDTPKKARLQGAYEYLRYKQIPEDPREIFDFFNIKERSGYKIIEEGAPSRIRSHQGLNETRGRKYKMSGRDVARASELLEDTDLGMEAKGMTWYALGWEMDFDIHPETIKNTMKSAFDYSKYKANLKRELPERTKSARLNWADTQLLLRPRIEDFHNIRYSDEFHAGFGPEGQLNIIRRYGDGMRYRFDNI